jgi:hypothetical protein
MPRPKCRILGCRHAATNFPQITVFWIRVPDDSDGTVALCDTHYIQYRNHRLDTNCIGAAQTVD